MSTVGFIGGGRVARILIGGWIHAGSLPESVLVTEPDDTASARLTTLAGRSLRVPLEVAAAADIVLLALHPPHIPAMLLAIRPLLTPRAILVSLAPKITLEQLTAATGTLRTARVIPNAPSIVGRGYNPVAFGPGLDAPSRATVLGLFDTLGTTPEVNERDLEAFAILTAMGPTYFWPQFQALRDVARGLGLSPAAVDAGMNAMLDGAVATLLNGGLTAGEVMDLVPVKPLIDKEPGLVAMYHELLPPLHAKITPAAATQAASASAPHRG